MVSTDLPTPARGQRGHEPVTDPLRLSVEWGRRYNLSVYSFGLACCAVEFAAASTVGPGLDGFEVVTPGDGPAEVDVLVVSGTVTDKMAPAVRLYYDQMTEPRYVVSFGACSNTGGPYWDSYAVTKGVDQLVPVDVYVPGCPPRPQALVHGIRLLHERIASGQVPR